MRVYSYADVIRKAEAIYFGTRDDLPTVDATALNTHFNTWASQLWEAYWWPEWTLPEQRTFRPVWASATSYGAPSATAAVERYHVRSGKYFQSLQAANLGNAPMSDAGVENSQWWAECAAAYSGNDHTEDAAYTVGTIVRNPDDNRYYQCHTAHTAGATLDSAKFGILTPFIRSVDYEQSGETVIGEVKAVWDRNPRVHFGNAQPIEFTLGAEIYVAGDENVVWVEFRQRPPEWTGDDWATGTTYALDDQVYSGGDYYKSLQANNTGHAVTDTAWWELIEFPYVFRDAVAYALAAELLDIAEKPEAAGRARSTSVKLGEIEFSKISRQQNQGKQIPMRR
jgi:hypothetical protein